MNHCVFATGKEKRCRELPQLMRGMVTLNSGHLRISGIFTLMGMENNWYLAVLPHYSTGV